LNVAGLRVLVDSGVLGQGASSVIEPGAELVVKNESDQPMRVVADPQETLTLKTRDRPQ
jgi:hypothetical protein